MSRQSSQERLPLESGLPPNELAEDRMDIDNISALNSSDHVPTPDHPMTVYDDAGSFRSNDDHDKVSIPKKDMIEAKMS
jgi:hypothetical protein